MLLGILNYRVQDTSIMVTMESFQRMFSDIGKCSQSLYYYIIYPIYYNNIIYINYIIIMLILRCRP